MKRFWRDAAAQPADGGWRIALDGKEMRLPAGGTLLIRHAALAQALADEWRDTGEIGQDITPDAWPLTALAATADLRVAPDPAAIVTALAAYGGSDLLCYRADNPEDLARRQHAAWQPWLDWAESAHGIALLVVTGIMPRAQPPEMLARIAARLATYDIDELTVLGVLVPILGSVILGLAVIDGRLDAQEALGLSLLDETIAAEKWGEDAEQQARHAALGREVGDAMRFLRIVRGA